jgi:hypothetical protein
VLAELTGKHEMNIHLWRRGLPEGIHVEIRDIIILNKMYVWEVGNDTVWIEEYLSYMCYFFGFY